jgi:hypothetical protein
MCLLFQLLDEILFGVQPETLPRSRSTCSSRPLHGRCFTDWRDEERFDSNTRVVNLLLAESGVDNIDDTIDGQGRFGDICRYDDFTTG